jgi:dUTP pyrophosphatase
MKTKVRFKKLDPRAKLPRYEKPGDAGMDLVYIGEAYSLAPGERRLLDTGLAIAVPPGFEAQVRSRSGRALNEGLVVLNSPGTIDSGFRGHLRVLVFNAGTSAVSLETGARVAHPVEVDDLDETERGEGGFGSTGVSSNPVDLPTEPDKAALLSGLNSGTDS